MRLPRSLLFLNSGTASLLLLLLLGTACSTTIDIKVRNAAQLSIPTFERVAIPEFASPNAPAAGAIVASKLTSAIQREGVYRIVEANAAQLERLQDAMADSQSRMARSGNELRPGQVETAQVFIFGTMSQFESKRETQPRTAYQSVQVGTDRIAHTDVNGRVYYTDQPVYEQRPYTVVDTHHYANLAMDLRVVDVESNAVLANVPYTRSDHSIDKGQETLGAGGDEAAQLAQGIGALASLLTAAESSSGKSADQMLQDMLDECVEDFLRKISPHFVMKTKELMESDDNEAVNQGIELAEAGAWDEAARFWEPAAEANDAAAANNLAIYYEQKEDNDKARELYSKAMRLAPGESAPLENLASLSRFSK